MSRIEVCALLDRAADIGGRHRAADRGGGPPPRAACRSRRHRPLRPDARREAATLLAADGADWPTEATAGAGCAGGRQSSCTSSRQASTVHVPGSGRHRHALVRGHHEFVPGLRRQRAAGDLLHRRAVVIAEPDAGGEIGGIADEPGVARILAGAGLAGGRPGEGRPCWRCRSRPCPVIMAFIMPTISGLMTRGAPPPVFS